MVAEKGFVAPVNCSLGVAVWSLNSRIQKPRDVIVPVPLLVIVPVRFTKVLAVVPLDNVRVGNPTDMGCISR